MVQRPNNLGRQGLAFNATMTMFSIFTVSVRERFYGTQSDASSGRVSSKTNNDSNIVAKGSVVQRPITSVVKDSLLINVSMTMLSILTVNDRFYRTQSDASRGGQSYQCLRPDEAQET